MRKISQWVPEGVHSLSVKEVEDKEQLLMKMKQLFKARGYRPVQTPAFEYYDLFSEIKGTMAQDQMIKLIDPDGKVLVLRPDATIPIARMVATNFKDGPTPLKFSYVTDIFRMNEDRRNLQSREFTQAGVEMFGRGGPDGDAEVIALAIDSLKHVDVGQFTIDIGQANFYKALMASGTHLSEEEKRMIKKRIETKNVAELDRAVSELDIPDHYKRAIRAIPSLCGAPPQVLREAEKYVVNLEMKNEIRRLKEVYERLAAMGLESYLSFDLGLINHLNYYTGIVFQGFVSGFGKPVLLGGRYDGLTRHFGYETKAIGFAVYVDDLITVLSGKGSDA